jgi:aryl-alcohol dehydrogenase-like predicted oxidoreductase
VEFCDARGVDIAKLALQFCLQNPDITTTVPGTANPDNMAKQLQWIDEPVDHELIAEVRKLLAPTENVLWRVGREENSVDWDAGL